MSRRRAYARRWRRRRGRELRNARAGLAGNRKKKRTRAPVRENGSIEKTVGTFLLDRSAKVTRRVNGKQISCDGGIPRRRQTFRGKSERPRQHALTFAESKDEEEEEGTTLRIHVKVLHAPVSSIFPSSLVSSDIETTFGLRISLFGCALAREINEKERERERETSLFALSRIFQILLLSITGVLSRSYLLLHS